MLLASTGMRAAEALALRHKDFDFDDEYNNNNHNNRQAFVRIRHEFTKIRTDRYVFLTREMVEQCKAWTDFKYRRHRITRVVNNTATTSDNPSGKALSYWIEPKANPDDC
jgi:integrase